MINVRLPGRADRASATTTVRRVTPRFFWLIFVAEGALIIGALLVMLQLVLPQRVPLAATSDHLIVRGAVWSRLNGTIADSQIEIAPGVHAQASQVRGLALNGAVYYYYLEGRQNFDPFSRGFVSRTQIELVARDESGPAPLVIYRIISKTRASDS